ncbi:alpha/beta hydrolase [Paenibacillus psychroresistens]|uniref:Alpha/beta hydrolase n=1 Tax=Paenibacillus psychroresistens TaxID=1778678 RepID=A0A6B8RRS4_9BACL|nr:alpha/beta hydrolase [Paenibacillus psychroresistens]QGQ98567.1 alpha/beta hydrolase [Paenibacillus psychroresistens]
METNILWIHGWGMSSQIWGDVSSWLPEVNHHFFSYAGCDTIDSFHVALSDKLLSAGENKQWTLVGWSLGAMLALEQWMNRFDNPKAYSIHSIIIVAGTLRFTNSNRQLGWPERVIERMRKQLQLNPQETLLQFASSMFSESDQESAEFTKLSETIAAFAQATDFTPAGLDAGLVYLRDTDLSVHWEVPYVQRPQLLWLHGADDPICPAGGMPDLNRAEVFVFPETGHIPFLTKPELFYDQVRSFLHANRPDDAQ